MEEDESCHPLYRYDLSNGSSGGTKGARGTRPPGPKSFNFMQFWRKFAKIICWCPPGELVPHLGEILDLRTGLRSQCRKIHVVPELPTHALTHIHTHAQTDRQTDTHVTYLSVGPDFSGCTCCLSPATTWCTGCCCGFACCLDGRIFSYSLLVARRRLTSFQAQ